MGSFTSRGMISVFRTWFASTTAPIPEMDRAVMSHIGMMCLPIMMLFKLCPHEDSEWNWMLRVMKPEFLFLV